MLTASGEKVFERKMNGINCATGKIVVPFSDHYHLYLYHAEHGRLKASPGYLTLVSSTKYQLLRLDSEGLYHFRSTTILPQISVLCLPIAQMLSAPALY